MQYLISSDSHSCDLFIFSIKPADIIPVGTATRPIPSIAMIALNILPKTVIG